MAHGITSKLHHVAYRHQNIKLNGERKHGGISSINRNETNAWRAAIAISMAAWPAMCAVM